MYNVALKADLRQRPVDVLFPKTQLPLASQRVKKKVQTPLPHQSSVASHRIASPRTAPRREHGPSRAPDLGTERSSPATLTTTPKLDRGFAILKTPQSQTPKSQYVQHRLRPCRLGISQEKEGCSTSLQVAIRNVPPAHPPLRRRARAAQNRRAERAHVPLSVRDASVGEMERYCVFGAFGTFTSSLPCYLYDTGLLLHTQEAPTKWQHECSPPPLPIVHGNKVMICPTTNPS